MLGLPLFGDSPAPAVRRPLFEVSFGAPGGAGDGGLLSAAAAAVGLGGAGGEDPWLRSVARIAVDLSLAPAVDVAELTLAADSQAPAVQLGDEGTIALGYSDGGVVAVFAGGIESARRDAAGLVRIAVANGGEKLAALRVQQSYEDQSAADIVEDLAGRAGVRTGETSAGPDLAFIVLDSGRTAWQHIARLARLAGHYARFDADGKLLFTSPDEGEPVAAFTWGVDLLSLERTESSPPFDAVTLAGEGSAGSDGKSAWNWLSKERTPVTRSAGSGKRDRSFADAALRSADAVATAARAIAAAGERAANRGTLLAPGSPAVVPGRLITISAPSGFDGKYLVERVRHTFDKRRGFLSRIDFAGAAGSGGGGTAGGLLGGLL